MSEVRALRRALRQAIAVNGLVEYEAVRACSRHPFVHASARPAAPHNFQTSQSARHSAVRVAPPQQRPQIMVTHEKHRICRLEQVGSTRYQ